MKNQVKTLFKKYNGKILPYSKLPRPHQLAMAWYMAVDGEAWKWPNDKYEDHKYNTNDKYRYSQKGQQEYEAYLKNVLRFHLHQWFVKKYGNKRFGVVEIPTDVLLKAIYESLPNDKPNIEAFYKDYENGSAVNHPKSNRWPVILDYNNEVIQDGYTRFRHYTNRGDRTIPCLIYP